MAVYKCKMCGGDLNITDLDKVVVCDYCGTTQTVPSADSEKKLTLFNRANRLRLANEFDKAAGIYENIVAEFPEEAEAYWGLCLCNYGIEYVDDPTTGKKIPTCHRASFQKLREDENFELAMEYADVIAQKVYRDEAREIDRINEEILSISRNESPYDVFICYKETDESGERTPDSVMAQDIYDALTAKGLKVFFARISLESKLGQQYEPYIFAALNSAKIMLCVGTKYEYFHAVWVKNEWSRFVRLAAKDKTKMLIPCYKDMDPYDLPDAFKGLQAQDLGKLGAIQDLVRGVEKLLEKDAPETPTEPAQTVVTNPSAATVEPLLKRAFMFLEDKNWQSADEYAERVLDLDPENSYAYLCKLMAEIRVSKREDLDKKERPFSFRSNYQKAVRFGEKSGVAEMLIRTTSEINRRNEAALIAEKNRKEEAEEKAQSLAKAIVPVLQEEALKKGKDHLKEDLEKAKLLAQKIDTVCRDPQDYDTDNALIKQKTEQKTILGQKYKQLSEKRDALGVFSRKEKKNIEDELFTISQKIRNLETAIRELSEKHCGFETKEQAEQARKALADRILEMEREISANQKGMSLEQALKILTSEPRVVEIICEDSKNHNLIYRFAPNLLIRSVYLNQKSIPFGRYQQNTKAGLTPIEWITLAKEGNKLLLLSKYALDCRPYNDEWCKVSWQNSTLRKWLNESFLKQAFTQEEQKIIQSAIVPADENPAYGTHYPNNTIDKVFLLSIEEVCKYYRTNIHSNPRVALTCEPTEYAVKNGAFADYQNSDNGKTTRWWLRSPGYFFSNAASIDCKGEIDYDRVRGGFVNKRFAVRPAIWIDLDA